MRSIRKINALLITKGPSEEHPLRQQISCKMIESSKNKSKQSMLIFLTDNNWSSNNTTLMYQLVPIFRLVKIECISIEYCSHRLHKV